MNKNILIIDDEQLQSEGLTQLLQDNLGSDGFTFQSLYKEDEILNAIENKFYIIAIVDLRMDGFQNDGMALIDKIFEYNPMAQIIIVSAFSSEYLLQIKDIMKTGKVLDVLDKEPFDTWVPKISSIIKEYVSSFETDPQLINQSLLDMYADAKNTEGTTKGKKLEHFLSMLFQSIGYNNIQKNIRDSTSEIDLIIRNEINDSFLSKFGKYILVESKNRKNIPIDKNDFVTFRSKLDTTNQYSELGIIVTTSTIAKTVKLEALRSSSEFGKIICLDNREILRLIKAHDKLEEFKLIIDSQIKEPICSDE